MKERFPSLTALALLIALVIGTWWAADYAQRAIAIDPPRRLTHEPDAWAQGFVMLRTAPDGSPINRLEGVHMQHYPDDDSYEITTPRAVGLRPGNPVTVGTSRTAVMDRDGKRITMVGDAHLHRLPDAQGKALDVRSQELVILPDDDLAYTDLPAEIVNGRSRMNGKGMRYNNKTRQLQVLAATDVRIAGEDARVSTRRPNDTPEQDTPEQP